MMRALIVAATALCGASAWAQTASTYAPGQPIPSASINSMLGAKSDFTHAVPGGVPRNVDQRLSVDVDVLDYGAVDGVHDPATVLAALAVAQSRLNAGQMVHVIFPPSRVVVSGSPTLTVPVGGKLTLDGRATEIYVTDAGNGLSVNAVPYSTGPALFGQLRVSGFQFSKALGQAGGAGLAINGAELSGSTMVYAAEHIGCQDDPAATSGWMSCLSLINTYGSASDIHGTFVVSGQALPGNGTLIALSSTGSYAAIDNTFSDIKLFGGFAGFTMAGHVEGVYIKNFALVSVAYGVYWPYSGTDVPADSGLLLTMDNGHINSAVRGVYTNRVGFVMLAKTLHLTNQAGQVQGAGTLLPIDNTQWNPIGPNWAAMDIQNAGNYTIAGNHVYGVGGAIGTSPAYAGIVVDSGACAPSCTRGQERPSAITGNTFTAVDNCAVYVAADSQNISLTGNMTEATGGLCASGSSNIVENANSWDGNQNIHVPILTDMVWDAPVIAGASSHEIYGDSTGLQFNQLTGPSAAVGLLRLDDFLGATFSGPIASAGLTSSANINIKSTTSLNVVGLGNVNGNLAMFTSASFGGFGTFPAPVATLPSGCAPGLIAYANNARKNGEAAGAGSGALVFCDNNHVWQVATTTSAAVQ